MTPNEYIIDKINELVNIFPEVKCRYEDDSIYNSHVVEVLPNEVYNLNSAFKDFESKTILEFIDKFPNDSLSFISDDALVGIDSVSYEVQGNKFNPFVFERHNQFLPSFAFEVNLLNESFDLIPNISNQISFNNIELESTFIAFNTTISAVTPIAIESNISDSKNITNDYLSELSTGEENYAFAA